MTIILFLLSSVGFPLTVLGGIMGKNTANGFDAPCRTKNIAREIPSAPWYHHPVVHMAVGGFLPFRLVLAVYSDYLWVLIKGGLFRQVSLTCTYILYMYTCISVIYSPLSLSLPLSLPLSFFPFPPLSLSPTLSLSLLSLSL